MMMLTHDVCTPQISRRSELSDKRNSRFVEKRGVEGYGCRQPAELQIVKDSFHGMRCLETYIGKHPLPSSSHLALPSSTTHPALPIQHYRGPRGACGCWKCGKEKSRALRCDELFVGRLR